MTSNQTTNNRARYSIDWAAIVSEAVVGVKSIRRIGQDHGVSHTAIVKHLRKQGLVAGSLLHRVHERTQRHLDGGLDELEFDKAIMMSAAVQVQVIREHRMQINRQWTALDNLTSKLHIALTTGESDLAGLTRTLESAVRSLTRLIAMERQAYGIGKEPQSGKRTYEERLTALKEQFSNDSGPIAPEHETASDTKASPA
ncbi:MAG: hypothetical protein AB7Q81_05100 [Gammaproteobacteria bacterium]